MADAILSQSGIYAITNKVNGKKYIGSAIHFHKRWIRHKSALKSGLHHSEKLQRAWNKYGSDAFELSILEIIDNKESMLSREQYWMDLTKCSEVGYNILCTAGSMLGKKHKPESIAKCRAAKVGVIFSDEHKAKLSAWQLGSKHSEETKAKRSASLKGRPRAPEVVAKMGRKNSPETIAKRIAKTTGLKRTHEQNERNRLAHIGKKLSPETIEKRTATWRANRAKKMEIQEQAQNA